nr:MAG TPA: hypothetical protein [Caudoviricetes sp.]
MKSFPENKQARRKIAALTRRQGACIPRIN